MCIPVQVGCTLNANGQITPNLWLKVVLEMAEMLIVHKCTGNREIYPLPPVSANIMINAWRLVRCRVLSTAPWGCLISFGASDSHAEFGMQTGPDTGRVSTAKVLALTPELGTGMGCKLHPSAPHCGECATRCVSLIFPQWFPGDLHRSRHKI